MTTPKLRQLLSSTIFAAAAIVWLYDAIKFRDGTDAFICILFAFLAILYAWPE